MNNSIHTRRGGQGPDARLDFPATHRNRDAILEVLARILPETGTVLEIGAGSGQHAVHFAKALPHLTWQPTDPNPDHRDSIQAWADAERVAIAPALDLDATATPWPVLGVTAVLSINMIHIAPWEACLGLLTGASRALPEGGLLYLYGPFKVGGQHTSPSNAQFDASLQMEDPSWGVRGLDEVALEARARDLHLVETVKMPANNMSVIFKKREGMA